MTAESLEIEKTDTPLEYQVFALAFKEHGAITRFSAELPAEAVGSIHGETGIHEFYLAFLDFYEKTGLDPVDPIAWKAWLESETDIFDSLGGAAGVEFFISTVMSAEMTTVDSAIKILRYRANKRKQLNTLQQLQQLIAKKGHKSDEDIAKISKLTDEIRSLESDLDYNPLDAVATAYSISDRADELMNIPDFLPTPFKHYNKALGYTEDGGYFRGALHAVVAPSGKGKSTFTKCLTNHWADLGYTTLYVNYEEAQAHWERILMTQVIGENVYANARFWTAQEKEERIQIFQDKLAEWGDRFMVRHDPDSSFYDDLELWLRDIIGHNENIPDVVVIDTLQSMLGRGGGPRWEQFERMMIRLEKLAKEMDAVFILTAQQNVNAAKEKREVVEQYDVGGSVAIVQKCSVVTFLTPKQMVNDDPTEDEFIMQLQIPKNRITGTTFIYDPPLVRYNDDKKSYYEFEMIESDDMYDQSQILASDIFGVEEFA
jgi:replicative DNA helicase